MTDDDGIPIDPNESKELVPVLDLPELNDATGEQALLSRIPAMGGGERIANQKADYLGYRATGFPVRQACYLAGMTQSTLNRWRRADEAFANVENTQLAELQSEVGNEIVKLEFLRNMKLAMRGDFKVFYKAVHNMDALTKREFEYLKRIRGLYSPQDMVNITRVLAPETDVPQDFTSLLLKVTRETAEVHITNAQEQPSTEPDFVEGKSKPA